MLEGITQTAYSTTAPRAPRLMTIGGRVSVAAAAETPITTGVVNLYGYLTYMRADCTVASTTAGYWILRDGVANTVLLHLSQPVTAAVVGSSYCWPFPVPWKTHDQADQFTIEPSVATMGTWQFIVNGFLSSI